MKRSYKGVSESLLCMKYFARSNRNKREEVLRGSFEVERETVSSLGEWMDRGRSRTLMADLRPIRPLRDPGTLRSLTCPLKLCVSFHPLPGCIFALAGACHACNSAPVPYEGPEWSNTRRSVTVTWSNY